MRTSPLRIALVAVTLVLAVGCGSARDVADEPVDRVLIVTLPGVAWGDVRDGELPALRALTTDAAIGDLSTRIGRREADNVAAYLTLGAGTRAEPPLTDGGVALEPDEAYRGVPAAEVLQRRLGFVPDGIAYLAFGAAQDRNERSVFGADVGTLGDELESAGVHRAVIANADQVEGVVNDPPVDAAYSREAATALMGSDGRLPAGAVSRRLLVEDPDAPFGQRLDPAAVLTAFDRVWETEAGDRVVVLVEASDLTRATAYRSRVTGGRRVTMRHDALAAADALLAGLIERVDPERDAVIVLSPVAPPGAPGLGVAALLAPGSPAGLLRSATTRRDGYVQLADVAPTVLALLGLEEPDHIEGRAFGLSVSDGGGRVASLADAADAAEFRDRMVAVVTVAFIAVLALLVAAVVGGHRVPAWLRAATAPVALAVLGAVPATFLVGALDASGTGLAVYVGVILAGGIAVAAAALVAERRWPGTAPVVAVAAVVVVIAGDIVAGAGLQVNTVFGYSVAVAGRFAGLGNLAFALLGSAAVIAAALLADRFGRAGVRAGVALLAAILLIDGLPVLGADVGGVVAMVPAFAATAMVLAGWRIGWRHVLIVVAATGATVLAFAFIDLARPVADRTHLARLAEHVIDARWGPFFDSFTRRWHASFGGAELAAWATIAAVMLGVAGYVAVVGSGWWMGRRAERRPRHRPTVAAVSGLAVLATVGLVANDSSFAVPATMLIVAVPVVVLRLTGGQLRLGPIGSAPS